MILRLALSVAALGASQVHPTIADGAPQVTPAAAQVAQLERDLAFRPRETRLYLELARAYEQLGRRDRAEATLRTGTVEARDPRLLRAALVDLLARGERWDDAILEATPLATDSAGKSAVARLQVNAGLAAYRGGDRQRARARWEAALLNDSTLIEGSVDLAALLLETGKRDSARAVVSRALRLYPTDARLLVLRARTLEGPEALAAALKALRQRRADDPGDEGTALELASLLGASGDRLAAMALYDTLVHAPTVSEPAYAAAVEFWMDGGDLKRASTVAQTGLERYPRAGRLNALLGEVEASRSEWRSAADAYRRAVGLTRDPATREQLELALLDVYLAGHDTAYGLGLARELTQGPTSRITLLQAAQRVAAELGATAVADSIYQRLLQRDSADVHALEAGAELAESSGDSAKAIALYRRAMALDSSGPAPPLALLRLTRPPPDTAQVMLRRALWRGAETLQQLEVSVAGAASGGPGGRVTPRTLSRARPDVQRKDRVLAMLRSTLDTVVFHTAWGRAELAQLRLAYPNSALFQQYAADLAVAEGGASDSVALADYDRLLRRNAADPETQRKRADVLLRLGRLPEALDGYSRALDLEPENEATFRRLQELRRQNGTLELLLAQLRRLRVRLPDSRVLVVHQIEVLQRLGRLAEAQSLAAELAKKKP